MEKNDLEPLGEQKVFLRRGILVHFVYYQMWLLDWFRNVVRTYNFGCITRQKFVEGLEIGLNR